MTKTAKMAIAVTAGLTVLLSLTIWLVVQQQAVADAANQVDPAVADTAQKKSAAVANPNSAANPNSVRITKPATIKYPVTIRKPASGPRCDTGLIDASGKAVTVACATCHATRKANFNNKTVADLNEFHTSLMLAHGGISCLSCHNAEDYDALKLADGSRVEFTEVMTLCAQCHGQQMKDYEHGAHGGMSGHWDLSRGPRTKNNCVDCHSPHAPQFPRMQPTFKPRDRFLEKDSH